MKTNWRVNHMGLHSILLAFTLISTQLVSEETLGKTPDDAPVFLYSQSASGGSLTGSGNTNLTLKMTDLGNVVLQVVVPEKGPNGPIENYPKTISVSSKYFYDSWDQVFGIMPQKALLTFNAPGNKTAKSIGLIVNRPKKTRDSIIFNASKDLLGVVTLNGLPENLQEEEVKIPAKFDSATLYIDNVQFFWDLAFMRASTPVTVSYDCTTTMASALTEQELIDLYCKN